MNPLEMALNDARVMKANWDAACNDIAELLDDLRAINEAINVDWLGEDEIALIRDLSQPKQSA